MKREIICGIYKITSPTGRIYIGKGTDLVRRMWDYASVDCKRQRIIYNSIIKHGWDSHKVEIIHQLPNDVSNEVLATYEMLYIQQYQSNINEYRNNRGMNLTIGGEGTAGHKWPKESIEKYKKTIADGNLRRGEKNGMFGRIGEKNHWFGIRGEKHHAYGKKRSEEYKAKLKLIRKRGGESPVARSVIDTSTGRVFDTVYSAAAYLNLHRSTLSSKLNGRKINNTSFKYY